MNALSNQAMADHRSREQRSQGNSVPAAAAHHGQQLRVLILVVVIGGWQLLTSVGIIDPFFWGQPSGIWNQLVTWVTQGTAQGSLWEQIGVTLEEAVLGFLIGVCFGVIVGVVLGRNRFLADILSPYMKAPMLSRVSRSRPFS